MNAKQLDQTFSALADPTRRALLGRLSRGETNVSDLAAPFLKQMSLPAVTKHLKVLESAGLVTKSRDAQYRPCRLNVAPLKEAMSWIDDYRTFWEESFDRLDEYLKTVTSDTKPETKAKIETKATTMEPQLSRASAKHKGPKRRNKSGKKKKPQ